MLQAWFRGRGYDRHRHDTYAIGLTDVGVQTFDYRGVTRVSTPGQVVVLHPDEAHDGRAGTPAGFGYRIVYVAPARIREATRAVRGTPTALPFVRTPVLRHVALAAAIETAFRQDADALAKDDLVVRIAEALILASGSGAPSAAPARLDAPALARAREFLRAETARVVRSDELEDLVGLSRYELARQFRAAFGTSPYRYAVLRRIDAACALLCQGRSPADVALATGFADQAHLSRTFKAALGVPPARYRDLAAGTARRVSVPRPAAPRRAARAASTRPAAS